jgi:hypothetical protein
MIKFAPPWLKALGGDASPLKDEAWIHDKLAKLRAEAMAEDARQHDALFRGPMAPGRDRPPTPAAVADILPDERRSAPLLPPAPLDQAKPPPPAAIDQVTGMPRQIQTGLIAPPGAPPPPPPADRPPGTFTLPTREVPEPHGPEHS